MFCATGTQQCYTTVSYTHLDVYKRQVEDRVSCRVSAQALFIVLAAVRVLYEFWRKKVLDIFL